MHDISLIADKEGVPTLCEVAVAYGNDGVAVDWIKAQLEVVNGFTNVQQRLNTEQLMAIGEQIFSLYPDLNLLEFALFCGRLRRGKYEKWYGAVDGQKILISLDAFVTDRRRDIAKRHEEKHRELMAREAAAPGMRVDDLIREHPGEYPTLEKLLENGGIYRNIARQVSPKGKRK